MRSTYALNYHQKFHRYFFLLKKWADLFDSIVNYSLLVVKIIFCCHVETVVDKYSCVKHRNNITDMIVRTSQNEMYNYWTESVRIRVILINICSIGKISIFPIEIVQNICKNNTLERNLIINMSIFLMTFLWKNISNYLQFTLSLYTIPWVHISWGITASLTL